MLLCQPLRTKASHDWIPKHPAVAQVALQRHPKLRQVQQQLIYDVLAVCSGIRPGVMIDYVRMTKQQLQQLLQAVLPHSHEAGVWHHHLCCNWLTASIMCMA
jgi:hypothetical protein